MKYYPILLSKAGELTALKQLTPNVKAETAPVIQVLEENFENVEALLVEEWNFQNNSVLLDFSLLDTNTYLVQIENLLRNCLNANVNVVPIVQTNSRSSYLNLIATLHNTLGVQVCIRTSSFSGGFLNYNIEIGTLVNVISANLSNVFLLFDFAYVNAANYNAVLAQANGVISGITNANSYNDIIVASGSFPENLGPYAANALHLLNRFEWDLWLQLLQLDVPIKYSDYGTKHPISSPAGFLGSCSIKYSNAKQFVIYRGEVSNNHPLGNGQYIQFSKQLVASVYYSGIGFSWGDGKIDTMAAQAVQPPHRPGNAKTWVEISQNHHITLLESLL